MSNLNNKLTCHDAEHYYYDFICNDSSCQVAPDIMDHIYSCKICLKKIEQLKAILEQPENTAKSYDSKVRNEINHILKHHFAYIDKPVSCNDVKPFLPYLLDADLEIRIPTPVTVHLNSCSKCHQDLETIRSLNLNKTQLNIFAQALSGDADINTVALQLQDSHVPQEKIEQIVGTISTISERSESGIVTICRIDKAAKTVSDDDSNIYAGFPIIVEQTDNNAYQANQNRQSIIPINAGALSQSKAAPSGRLLKPAIVAAAVILLAAGLFLNTPTVKAVSIQHIYRAMDKIKNIYIANFAPDSIEPKQEFWFARQQNVYITKTKHETVFYDLDNAQRRVKLQDSDTIENITITENQVSVIRQWMYSYFGVMPFANISDIPADAQWNRVTDETLINNDNIEIYELIWKNQKSTGSKGYWKYRFYVDAKTYLPFKIEVYRKLNIEEEYTLENLKLVKYLDHDDFEAVAREKGF